MSTDSVIFNIGAHKTGTCSLVKAMKILGYKHCSETVWYSNKKWKDDVCIRNDYSSIVTMIEQKLKEGFNFFEDSPYNFNDVYKQIDTEFCNAKFVMTCRDPDDWYDSFYRWSEMPYYKAENKAYPLAAVYSYGHDIVKYNDETKHIVEGIKERYTSRKNDILAYFSDKKDKLCIIGIDDSSSLKWNTLCTFLGIQNIPSCEYPHLNKSKRGVIKK
jgi:hypothetical protein